MKISEPNYTQAPNVFFDEVFKTLTEGELRIVLVLVRQTFGWHKPVDRISLSQLADKTGMPKTSVCRSLNTLLYKNLIQKHKFGSPGQERVYYSLVVEQEKQELPPISTDGIETEEEMALISKNLYQSLKETPPVSERDPPQSLKETHKRNYSKETIQNKQQQAAAVSLSSSFEENGKPRISPKLHGVNIPPQDKFELAGKYDEKTIDDAIDWSNHPETKIKQTLAQALKWACANKITPPKPPLDLAEENRSYAKKYDGMKNGGYTINVLSKCVEIDYGTAYKQPFTLEYTVKAFKEQFDNALRKANFPLISNALGGLT